MSLLRVEKLFFGGMIFDSWDCKNDKMLIVYIYI